MSSRSLRVKRDYPNLLSLTNVGELSRLWLFQWMKIYPQDSAIPDTVLYG